MIIDIELFMTSGLFGRTYMWPEKFSQVFSQMVGWRPYGADDGPERNVRLVDFREPIKPSWKGSRTPDGCIHIRLQGRPLNQKIGPFKDHCGRISSQFLVGFWVSSSPIFLW